MIFQDAIKIVCDNLHQIGTTLSSESYDGLIVKKLEASNTLDDGRTTNQTHIAITGAQMDIFPYLKADGYFSGNDNTLKKFFVVQIPIVLFESNCGYLSAGSDALRFTNGTADTTASIVRCKRTNAADQIQMSIIRLDDEAFINFRKLLHTGDFLVILKSKKRLSYHVVGIRSEAATADLRSLNNKFFKLPTNTVVNAAVNFSDHEKTITAEEHKDSYTKEELAAILRDMYHNAKDSGQVAAIHMFGFKYGDIITEKSYSQKDIITFAGINDSYTAELNQGINIFKSVNTNEYGVSFDLHDSTDHTERDVSETDGLSDRAPRTKHVNPLNLIIYGAPGTGKTYSTTEYAVAAVEGRAIRKKISPDERRALKKQFRALANKGQIVFTTFHQNYSYEDFIQGLRPDSQNGVLNFAPVDGVFKKLADTAMRDPENNYVIIIDEINRGNISKIFGELITLIEEDKRWGEENQLSVTLPGGKMFAVPNNLYIIGTMNSADKSIALIDTALRRRFDFEEVAPDPELVTDEVLKKVLISLNKHLRKQLDSSDLLIGHAYFIDKTETELPAILNRNIIPLLYEYFYDQERKVKDTLAKALEGTSVDFDDNTQGRLKVK